MSNRNGNFESGSDGYDEAEGPRSPSGMRGQQGPEIPGIEAEPRRKSNPHLNDMLAHAATITNHAGVLDTAASGIRSKVAKSIETLSGSLIDANQVLRGRRKNGPANAGLKHLKTALGSASEIASAIALHRPNSLSHHESQTALTGFIAAHNELVKSLAQHGE
jgi:hypothetical protein